MIRFRIVRCGKRFDLGYMIEIEGDLFVASLSFICDWEKVELSIKEATYSFTTATRRRLHRHHHVYGCFYFIFSSL